MKHLAAKIVFGAFWSSAGRITLTLISLLSTVILARFLLPADFGLVAIAMSVAALLDVLSTLGFDMWLIKENEPTRDSYNTAWTMNSIRGFVLGAALSLCSLYSSLLFDDPRCRSVFLVMAAIQVIEGVKNIGIVNFRKELDFKKEFNFNLISKLASFSATIISVHILSDYRALLIGMLAGAISHFILSFILSAYRPAWCLRDWRRMITFSKWLLANNVLLYINRRLVTVIIGTILPTRSVGLYTVSSEIGKTPTTELVWPLTRVLFPSFSKIKQEKNLLRDSYLKSLSVITLIGTPLGLGLSAVSAPLVSLCLGPAWDDAGPLVAYIAAFGILSLNWAGSNGIYLALDRPQIQTKILAFSAIWRLPLLLFFVPENGAIGAAVAMGIADVILLIANWYAVGLLLRFDIGDLIKHIWRPWSSAAIMWLGVFQIETYVINSFGANNPLALLMLLTLSGALIYSVLLFALWVVSGRPKGGETTFLQCLKLFKENTINRADL
jgi:lipopolysaccharide exporter